MFPLHAAKALAQDKLGPPEKKDLKIGFIPITCATPIIMAEPMRSHIIHFLVECSRQIQERSGATVTPLREARATTTACP